MPDADVLLLEWFMSELVRFDLVVNVDFSFFSFCFFNFLIFTINRLDKEIFMNEFYKL